MRSNQCCAYLSDYLDLMQRTFMAPKTTTEVTKVLALTPKALLLTLVYHPELCPSALGPPLSWGHLRQAQWSDAEIERVRLHCTTHQRRRAAP